MTNAERKAVYDKFVEDGTRDMARLFGGIRLDRVAILDALDAEVIAGRPYPTVLRLSQEYIDQEVKKSGVNEEFPGGVKGYMLGCEVFVDEALSGAEWAIGVKEK